MAFIICFVYYHANTHNNYYINVIIREYYGHHVITDIYITDQ